jgi:general stress protein 26
MDNDLPKLRSLVKDIKTCMMTTLDEDGRPHSRPMHTQQLDGSDELWFLTSRSSLKVAELGGDEHVNLSFADPAHNRYLSISGTATTLTDRAKLKELWNVFYRAWWPEGMDDPDIVLMKVTLEKAEYWDSPGTAVVHAIGFAKAVLFKQPYKGDHGSVDVSH